MVAAARLPAARHGFVEAASWPADISDPAILETGALLTAGGDSRIELDETSGVNRYGCAPAPDPEIAPYGSSTASTISPAAFAAALSITCWPR